MGRAPAARASANRAGVHPTAIVADGAMLGEGVTVGPYCVVGPNVTLDSGVALLSHVVVEGRTQVGQGTRIWPFASIGHAPQDLKYAGEESYLSIGRDCMIREHVTMNPGTAGGGLHTRVGDRCLFMMGAHVGHDCRIADGVILANNATVAGHVEVGTHAFLGGLSAVHQFVRIGAQAMVGGMTGVEKDVIPYGTVIGNRADLGGLNVVGMKRRGFDKATLQVVRRAYKAIFYGEGTLPERAAAVADDAEFAGCEPVRQITDFILAGSQRKFCTPRDA